jgi:rubrerythrin
MNFLRFAKTMELQSLKQYRELAEGTQSREIAGIFNFLAEEEEKHFNIFDAWERMDNLPTDEDSGISEYAKKVFQTLADRFRTTGVSAIDRDDAYVKALGFESESIQFYTDTLNGKEITDETQRTILKNIIDQEKRHAWLITSLMEFQRHPGEWLENAEWNHSEAY